MDFEVMTLANGLRVLYQHDAHAKAVHCAFAINAGSRDELENEHGIAHLIEHCFFKGTTHRKAFHILTRLDSVGGELNAYTTKEETCLYASALPEHFSRAAELLADVLFNRTFPDKELEKEKSVVMDEINSYRDNPDEMLMDEFDALLFANHPIGRCILGTEQSLRPMGREALLAFTNRMHTADQCVFACTGPVPRAALMGYVKKHLEPVACTSRNGATRKAPLHTQFEQVQPKAVHQVHALMGGVAPSLASNLRLPMVLLNNILGGPALNSRLNLNIRERRGYCYFIESSYSPFTDTGLFEVYFGTDVRYFERTAALVQREMNRFVDEPIKPRALTEAKQQLMAQFSLGQENRSNNLLGLARTLLHFQRIDTLDELKSQVNSVSPAQLQALAAEVFAAKNLSRLAYVPL